MDFNFVYPALNDWIKVSFMAELKMPTGRLPLALPQVNRT